MNEYTISYQTYEINGPVSLGAGNERRIAGLIFRNRGNTDMEINGIPLMPGEVLDLMTINGTRSVDVTRYNVQFKPLIAGVNLPDVERVVDQTVNKLEAIIKMWQ